ncbi:F-box domain containing protein [Pandoravirus quercus]|uniref:F-box domain containing protein n=1 Tax=Pandoravirus quercus TaxID=2107709 RepID=A0A2U7UAT6_9VIRU|nr:F-box domain containing protein [Pandoravirus quercus]AVK75512.1 F-box domain containing protein [Pandoravirus quercus]
MSSRKSDQRRRPGRYRRKKCAAAATHDGCFIGHLVPCCAPAVAPRNPPPPPQQGIGFGDLPDELVAAILARLSCLDLCRDAARVCTQWRAIVHDASAVGRSPCTSAGARKAFLQGPLLAERVGGFRGTLLKESLAPGRRGRKRPRVVLARMLAADSGHVDCMARLNAHPWYDGACLVPAAVHGHLDILEYAHGNRCPWHYGVCTAAEAYGRIDCLRYVAKTGGRCALRRHHMPRDMAISM